MALVPLLLCCLCCLCCQLGSLLPLAHARPLPPSFPQFPKPTLTADTLRQYAPDAMQTLQQLPKPAQRKAQQRLAELNIPPEAGRSIRFDKTGEIFVVEDRPILKHHYDPQHSALARGRRILVDSPPSSYDENGLHYRSDTG